MARDNENDDPEQKAAASYFAADPEAPLPEAKDVVIGGSKDDAADSREGVRRGDRKPLQERRSERAPPDPPRGAPVPKLSDGVDELQRQMDRETEARKRAEAAATAALQRANVAEARYGQAASGMIESSIEAAVRASDQATARFQAAMDISDHATAAKAQVDIADARHNLLRLQEQRQMLADDETRRKAAPPQRQQPQGDNLSRITAELDRTGYRQSAEWLRAHPEMVRDQSAVNRVDGAHGYIVNVLKIPVESDRYFDEMERILLDDDPEPREPRRAQREPNRAAPVSRSAPSLRNGETRRTVHLSPEQRAHARDVLGMTDEEYAESLADAEDKGKLLRMRR